MELKKLLTLHEELNSKILDRLLIKVKENGNFADLITNELTKESFQNSKVLLVFDLLALNTEVSELANSTRCFKYWSQQAPEDKKRVLEELIDIYLMLFSVTNDLKFTAEEIENGCIEKLNINLERQINGY